MESGKQTGDEDGDGDDSDDGGCGVEGAGGEGGGGESSNVEDEVIAGNVPGNPERDAKDLANLLVQGGPGTGKTWNRSAIDRVSKKRCRAERRRVEDPLPHPRCPQARLTQEHPAQRRTHSHTHDVLRHDSPKNTPRSGGVATRQRAERNAA